MKFLFYCLYFLWFIKLIRGEIIINGYKLRNELPKGFYFLDENNPHGPITTNRKLDNGSKRNLYNIIRKENEDYYYNYNEFNKLNDTLEKKTEYFCETRVKYRPEGMERYDISCPKYYSLMIDKAFYGRYANDTITCGSKENFTEDKINKIKKNCGYDAKKNIKEICEGKVYCSILPANILLKDKCKGLYKYLHVDYHCVKNKELKHERIAIVMFFDGIKPNTIDENSVSDFYQYSNIHGYDFYFGNYNYNPERKIYFMKFNTILEKLLEGLRDKKYDWIFWVDTDTILTNPNLRLETFLPNDNMNKVHFIVADDNTGLQAGVFFIRVHEWSLKVVMKTMTYCYYNKRFLKYHDQSSINNVLTAYNETSHYVVVPQRWFNNNFNTLKPGDLLLHIMGNDKYNRDGKDRLFKKYKNETSDRSYYQRTNQEMREEVLKYYDLPREEQHSIEFQ